MGVVQLVKWRNRYQFPTTLSFERKLEDDPKASEARPWFSREIVAPCQYLRVTYFF